MTRRYCPCGLSGCSDPAPDHLDAVPTYRHVHGLATAGMLFVPEELGVTEEDIRDAMALNMNPVALPEIRMVPTQRTEHDYVPRHRGLRDLWLEERVAHLRAVTKTAYRPRHATEDRSAS